MSGILSNKCRVTGLENAMQSEVEADFLSDSPGVADAQDARAVTSKPSRERLQALERGLETLSFINRFGAATSTHVAKAVGLKRSTAHRILAVLVDLGLLRHDGLSHQYILSARVGELSSGFRDDDWVAASALPLMKAWTLQHQWPVVLTTPLAGRLVVRASTDYESPMSVDRFHCGQVIPVEGSTAGLIYQAYCPGGATLKSAEEMARIRAAGYVARPTACFTGGRISVPLRRQAPFMGCITMRARAENIEVISEVREWAASLQELAARIQCGDSVAPT
jgi:IclR family mhp operon transcriptional activator